MQKQLYKEAVLLYKLVLDLDNEAKVYLKLQMAVWEETFLGALQVGYHQRAEQILKSPLFLMY